MLLSFHPQSYRDLALAYIDNKQYQEAMDMFIHILDHEWGHFENIKDIVLNELNGLVLQYKDILDMREINKEYIHAIPLDARITINWVAMTMILDLRFLN